MTNRRHILQTLAAATGLAITGLLPAISHAAEPAPRFTTAEGQFMLDGKPFQILAGEMHYPRIPRASWRDRMQKLKSLGLNTLTTYVFWNAHEPQPGVYDFSDNLDIAAYVKMAQEEGLWVNLRPGPYVCAEWDGGGLPAWLFPTPDIAARTTDPRFLTPVKGWLKRLGTELKPLLISQGGPVILTQVENEYGAFGKDAAYMQAMEAAVRDAGFDGMLYTADPGFGIASGNIPGLVSGVNFGTNYVAEKEFAERAQTRSDGPFFCSELWGGWFDAYGDMHSSMEIAPLMASLKWMLDRKMSISFYMLHGGTSWGFYAGANFDAKKGYQPDISSYDYDAILDEAGRPTPKYYAALELFKNYLPASAFAPLPAPEPSANIARFRLSESAALTQLLPAAKTTPAPQTLEALGQMHGLMLYRHKAKTALKGTLSFGDVRDYAQVSVNGQIVATLDRRLKESSCQIDLPKGAVLDVLVDTQGHVNYGKMIGKDQKGLLGPVTVNGVALEQWSHQGLPLDDIRALTFSHTPAKGPAFYRGTFEMTTPGYSFLDMRGWGKGYVWVNGHNLGHYWSVGPQHAVFVPGAWLKTGANEVIVLDLDDSGERTLAGTPNQIWDRPGLGVAIKS